MQKTLVGLFVLTFLSIFVKPSFAVEEVRMQPLMTEPGAASSPAVTRPLTTPRVLQKQSFHNEINNKRMEVRQTVSSRGASLTTTGMPMQNARVQQINSRFAQVNDQVLDTWATALDQLEKMVERASSESAALEAVNADTTAVDAAIARAEFAISTAKAAVRVQAGKTYTLPESSPSMLQTPAVTLLNQMRADMRITHMSVVSAKTAVRSTMSALIGAKQALLSTPSPVASGGAVIGE